MRAPSPRHLPTILLLTLPLLLPLTLPTTACTVLPPPSDWDLHAPPLHLPVHLELDRWGRVRLIRVPTSTDDIPPRAAHAAASIQPGGEILAVEREQGPHGTGLRWTTRYDTDQGPHLRTVLVTDAGAVLHKTWQVPVEQTPPAVLQAARRGAPGEVLRVEVGQERGPAVEWRVHLEDAHGGRWTWRGNEAGQGRAFLHRGASLLVEQE